MKEFYNKFCNSGIDVTGFLQTKPSHTYTVGLPSLSGRSRSTARGTVPNPASRFVFKARLMLGAFA
jgi:hypothetical protein